MNFDALTLIQSFRLCENPLALDQDLKDLQDLKLKLSNDSFLAKEPFLLNCATIVAYCKAAELDLRKEVLNDVNSQCELHQAGDLWGMVDMLFKLFKGQLDNRKFTSTDNLETRAADEGLLRCASDCLLTIQRAGLRSRRAEHIAITVAKLYQLFTSNDFNSLSGSIVKHLDNQY